MKIIYKKIAKFLAIVLLLIVIATIALFAFRNLILSEIISKVKYKLETRYDAKLFIAKSQFNGLSQIEVSNVSLVPNNADTLMKFSSLKIKINVYKLLVGDVQVENLFLKNGYLQFIKNKNGKNFAAFIKSSTSSNNQDSQKINYSDFASTTINKLLDLIPEKMFLENISLKINDLGIVTNLALPKLTLQNEFLESTIIVQTNTFNQQWVLTGSANPRKKIADLIIKNSDTTKIKLPYIDQKYHFITSFNNLHFKIDNIKNDGNLHINGMTSVDDLTINNAKIARKNVVFKKSKFYFNWLIGTDFIALDKTSIVELNAIKIHPYVEYSSANDQIYKFKANIDKMNAQDFISSLPKGLFPHFDGMIASGNFTYNIDINYNKTKPWQLTFKSNLQRQNLKVVKYGSANLEKLNTDFDYRAIDNNVEQRPIAVHLNDPNYATLAQISPYLQQCVLTCEDPSFMTHKGFINEAFRQSILKNMRTNKFSRGASTISMQLVKNIFLTREKTISRKLEEILLVYILENNQIATKARMLEIYFNIIEWGPDVYGIGEAAQFYFQKKPIDLSLTECLFLATIIPSPKKFMHNFDASGTLKNSAQKRQNFIKTLMIKKGLITLDSLDTNLDLKITGSAQKFLNLKTLDSTAIEQLEIDDF